MLHKYLLSYLFTLFIICLTNFSEASSRPHIIFILADDLGWNDVGFHGSAEIPTPNLDALAYAGLILNNYYVTPICTPSRSALMTGKYPIRNGMQHTVIYGAEPRGLPLSDKILPQYLKELGYATHIVGKWHLGHYKKEYTPLYRGFDSHIGYWTGHHDYFDHTAVENPSWGLDIRRGMDVAYDLHGKYTTDLIGSESVKIINQHNTSQPLFLYMAHAAVHSGNPYNPLPAPDETVAKLSYIENFNRRKFAAMLTHLDQSVGCIVQALSHQNMLKDSIIIFSTDNGGPAEGFNLNAASNWPLRGVKNTLWEGGVRGSAFLWSPLIEKSNRVANQSMHITDWLPTLYSIAGGNLTNLDNNIDGNDVWNSLSTDTSTEREEILHNIDDIWGSASLTIGNWKIHKGTNYKGQWDYWYGPSGKRDLVDYNFDEVITSDAGIALRHLLRFPTKDEIMLLREEATITCDTNNYNLTNINTCRPLEYPCLFNIQEDPCEKINLAYQYPNILNTLLRSLDSYNKTAVPPTNKPLDPRGDPRHWDNTWTNFGDYDLLKNFETLDHLDFHKLRKSTAANFSLIVCSRTKMLMLLIFDMLLTSTFGTSLKFGF